MTLWVRWVFLLALVTPVSYGSGTCGNIKADAAGYGPFNYNDPWARKHKIPKVDGAHFTSSVENLESGNRGYLGGDLDYTLRHIPNHHRALYAMMRFALRSGRETPPHVRYPMACWFKRAEEFAPHDGVVRMIHGVYLADKGNLSKGIKMVEKGLDMQPGNPTIAYNLGLLYFRAKRYDDARKQAKSAYAKGFPLPGLREMLKSAGEWSNG